MPPPAAYTGHRSVHFREDALETSTWDRMELTAGNLIDGPALIEEHASTTVLHPGDTCEVDDFGNLLVTVGGPAS